MGDLHERVLKVSVTRAVQEKEMKTFALVRADRSSLFLWLRERLRRGDWEGTKKSFFVTIGTVFVFFSTQHQFFDRLRTLTYTCQPMAAGWAWRQAQSS